MTKLVQPAREIKTPVEAEYGVVNKQVMVQPERAEWVQVLCDQNATPEKISQVKAALAQRGYPVTVDGNIDESLSQAITQFQADNELETTGLMTARTVDALGVGLD
jgi:peptidoglycan hydrolase-like protein with peptidoglycan-binding domain